MEKLLLSFLSLFLGTGCLPEMEELNFPPIVTLLSPQDEGIYNAGEPIALEIEAQDPEGVHNQLKISWMSDIDGAIVSGNPDGDGYLKINNPDLTAGSHELTVFAVDPQGAFAHKKRNIRVNSLPEIRSAAITPEFPLDDLQVQILDSYDAKGESIDHQIEWYQNGILVGDQT